MNKIIATYTIVVVSYMKWSSFLLYVDAESRVAAEKAAIDFADAETGCGPYHVEATFAGKLQQLKPSLYPIHHIKA